MWNTRPSKAGATCAYPDSGARRALPASPGRDDAKGASVLRQNEEEGMGILIIVAAVAASAGVIYRLTTRPCGSGLHTHRHFRFRHHRGNPFRHRWGAF